MKLKVKNKPTMTLLQMLRRRKLTLGQYVLEQGITTYDALVSQCQRLGVTEPTKQEFGKANLPLVSNPEEGVVVIDPVPLLSGESGLPLEEDAPRPTLNAVLDIKVEKKRRKTSVPPVKLDENDE